MTAYVLERKQYWKYGIGTEPNVALVGSPTISNAVASGFSSSNYLKISDTFNPKNSPWEAVFKFTVANVTTYQYLIGVVASGFAININGWNFTNSKLRMSLSSTSSSYDMGEIVGVTTLVNGNTYWVKLLFTGSQYQLLLSDNAAFENATVECSVDSTKVISSCENMLLGGVLENSVNSRPWQGSIDLTQSYIKINNKIWWYGTKAIKSNKDNYDFTTGKAYVLKRKRPKEYRKKVIDTATAGTYTFDVAKDTTARIILVGGGGGGGQVWSGHAEGSGGGSGACVYIKAKLTAGTYTITNGAGGGIHTSGGNSTLSLDGTTLITAGAGSGGQDAGGAVGVGGKYSFADNAEIEKIIFASNGKNGTVGGNMGGGVGGASVYKGYGKGGNTRTGGNSGYIWVELTTDETDYDYKIDNDACYVLKRKQYWKYEYQDWTQPVLTSNTSDSSFVVSASSELEASLAAWKSFDGVIDSNCWISTNVAVSEGAPQYYYITTDTPLKISNISVTNRTGNYPHPVTKGILQASVNGNEWFDIVSIDNDVVSAGSTWTIVANETTGYKYHRIKITEYYLGSDNQQYVALGHLVVDAQKAIAVKATKDDYDFITD